MELGLFEKITFFPPDPLLPTTTLHTKTEAYIDDKRLLEICGGGGGRSSREGSMPPAHGLRTEGGGGARRRRLQRSINVGGCRGETADHEDDDEDDDHHGRSPPPAPPSAEPKPRADDRAGGGARRHRRQRGRRRRRWWGRRRRLPPRRSVPTEMRHLPDCASPHDGLLREVRHSFRQHGGQTRGVVRDRGERGDQGRRSSRRIGGGGGDSGGGTYSLIVNRLALHRNQRTPCGGSLTYSIGTERRRDGGGWRLEEEDGGGGGVAGGAEGMVTIYHDVPPNN